MVGQITTADFYFQIKSGRDWAAVKVFEVIVTIDQDGALTDPEFMERRAARRYLKGRFNTFYPEKFKLIKYELTGQDLGSTSYKVKSRKNYPWE